jgi:diguanylate cyclase (GGDEF)-like protein
VSDSGTSIAEALANRPRPNVREPIAIWPVLENASRLVGILVLSRSDKISQWSRHTDSLVRLVVSGLERILEREYDSLTGLVNWSGFESVLNTVRDSADDCILMFMDVDKLHVVNDTFGRETGDAVLRSIADLLRSELDGNVIARITDDSYGVLLKGLSIGDAETAGQNICQLVRDTNYTRGSESFRPSISIGLAELDDATKSATDWLAHAQVACQAAKDRGCGRVEIYQSSDASIIRRMDDISMIGSIRNAVDSGRLVLYAQPIVPLLQAGAEQHFELLVRLLDATGRFVEPAEFIRTAERYQLIQDIDRWVVTKALETLQRQQKLRGSQNLRFAINLSGQSLGNDQFLEFIRAEIARLQISPAWLCFEITETVAMSNLSKAQVFISELKRMGCRFSLDDFGTGLSSFAYLKLFPVDKLKIDGSFVHDICDNDVSRGMVAAIVQLARVMQIETVAEYVQDAGTLNLLRHMGVDWAQGFYVGEPMRLSELLSGSDQPDYTDTTTLDTVRLETLPA